MTYYADAVTDETFAALGRNFTITASTAKDAVQLYRNGTLESSVRTSSGRVQFIVPPFSESDILFLLAVDEADMLTDFWDEAFTPTGAENRLSAKLITSIDQLSSDRWRVYTGAKGAGSATVQKHEAFIFPGGERSGGWGSAWGQNWGFGDFGAGWGASWGYSWGFGATILEWKSEPKPPGTYPIKITIVDEAGNESSASSDSIELNTFPRVAKDLTVESFDKGTDTLALSFTESEDL